jgi:hypothetical protein
VEFIEITAAIIIAGKSPEVNQNHPEPVEGDTSYLIPHPG